ncbi:MAG: hypothetical protein KF784_00640 [Fimbriimonadaceae bacterium]|nr:hypothetical protein [Fimbriimonadaceae bacterium]
MLTLGTVALGLLVGMCIGFFVDSFDIISGGVRELVSVFAFALGLGFASNCLWVKLTKGITLVADKQGVVMRKGQSILWQSKWEEIRFRWRGIALVGKEPIDALGRRLNLDLFLEEPERVRQLHAILDNLRRAGTR